MIKALEGFPTYVLAFACHGHVTKQDYEAVLIPAVERALEHKKKIRLYYEIAADFAGIDSGAVLEDAWVGLSHLFRWERFAVVTDVEWIRNTMKLFGFLAPWEMKVFSSAEVEKARAWIVA